MRRTKAAERNGKPEASEEREAPGWQTASDVQEKPLKFLWQGRILHGALNIIEGEKGVGKSTLMAAIVAHVTGGPKLFGTKKRKPGNVMWLPGEEDVASIVRNRLIVAGACLPRVIFPGTNPQNVRRRLYLPTDMDEVRDAVNDFGVALLIVDPLSCFVDPRLPLTNDQAIHSVLDPLADMAHASGTTVIYTRNLTKDRTADRLNRGLGGAAVGGVARCVLAIDWPDRRYPRRVLRSVARNVGGLVPSLEYELAGEGDFARMVKAREIPLEDDSPDDDLLDQGERDVRQDARTLLRRLIGDKWIDASAILKEANGASIGERTLRSVKAELGVRSKRLDKSSPPRWQWGPPAGGWKD